MMLYLQLAATPSAVTTGPLGCTSRRITHMNKPIMKGKVYLMGAGPGDPDLLTVQAVRILRSAEVVLHDHLVAQAILDLIPAWTQVRNVGKRCGSAGISQEQIHSLLISAAREGHQVVRLKGGDPLLFGRVGEEMEALSRAGIDFEVVPGVTSAMGAAAAAKIPLTDRRFASKLVFMSNHSAGQTNTNWEDVTSPDATHIVYMPGPNYAEIGTKLSAGGLDGRTPCLIVTHATQPEQQIRRTRRACYARARLPMGAARGSWPSAGSCLCPRRRGDRRCFVHHLSPGNPPVPGRGGNENGRFNEATSQPRGCRFHWSNDFGRVAASGDSC